MASENIKTNPAESSSQVLEVKAQMAQLINRIEMLEQAVIILKANLKPEGLKALMEEINVRERVKNASIY